MKIHRMISVLLLAVFLSAFVIGGERAMKPANPDDIGLQLIGEAISIEELINIHPSPVLAYSDKSNHFLVVYDDPSENGNVKGRFVDAASGKLTGDDFDIGRTDAYEGNPDVAYDPYNDVFLVVYTSEKCAGEPERCSDEIKGRLVEEPDLNGAAQAESPLGPNEFTVASQWATGENLADPRVAYNADDHQYLVVFRAGFGDYADLAMMYGQMLSSDKDLPELKGPEDGFFLNITFDYYYSPEVAWASESGTFLVVNVETDTLILENATFSIIKAQWLYDTYQGGEEQVIGTSQIAPLFPFSKFCYVPIVAYDPISDSYTVVFSYDKKGEAREGMTIYAQRLTGEFDPTGSAYFIGEPFPIEKDLSMYFTYFSPVITYSGPGDTMHVTYIAFENNTGVASDITSLYLRALHGSQVSHRTLIRQGKKDLPISFPNLAGALQGLSLVVWNEEPTFDYWDILGQRVRTFDMTYLPSIFNKN